MFAKRKPDVTVPPTRGTMAEQLAALRATRAERLGPVEDRRRAAAVEAARAHAAAIEAERRLREAEAEAIGLSHGADTAEGALERRLAEGASPAIGAFLELLESVWSRDRHVRPEPLPGESESEAWARHRSRVEAFHRIRREALALRYAELPDLDARLATWARDLNLPWLPPAPRA